MSLFLRGEESKKQCRMESQSEYPKSESDAGQCPLPYTESAANRTSSLGVESPVITEGINETKYKMGGINMQQPSDIRETHQL